MGGGGGKGVGATWPDTVKQSGAGGTLTPADRHGSVQVSLPAHLPSFLSRAILSTSHRSFSPFLDFLCIFSFLIYCRDSLAIPRRKRWFFFFSDATLKLIR